MDIFSLNVEDSVNSDQPKNSSPIQNNNADKNWRKAKVVCDYSATSDEEIDLKMDDVSF